MCTRARDPGVSGTALRGAGEGEDVPAGGAVEDTLEPGRVASRGHDRPSSSVGVDCVGAARQPWVGRARYGRPPWAGPLPGRIESGGYCSAAGRRVFLVMVTLW